jgi:hypothetical protein
VREHAWGDGPGVRCAGACSGKVRVVEAEAAAQVSSLGLMAPTGAACAARIFAAAASPASAFASTVFLATCAFGDAAVDEGGEGGCRSCQEGNRRQICPLAHPPPAHGHGEGYAVLGAHQLAPPQSVRSRVESIFHWYLEQRKNERSGCPAGFVDVLPRLGEAAPAGAGATMQMAGLAINPVQGFRT